MFSILVHRSNRLPNKTFIYSKTVFFPSHPAADSWLGPSVVWTHTYALFLLAHESQGREEKPSSVSFSLRITTFHFPTHFPVVLFKFGFNPVLETCPKVNDRAPVQHPRVQHLSLWSVWVCNMEPMYMCAHVCACHSWHSTPAQSVVPCVHQAGSGALTTVKAAGMLSFIHWSCNGIFTLWVCICVWERGRDWILLFWADDRFEDVVLMRRGLRHGSVMCWKFPVLSCRSCLCWASDTLCLKPRVLVALVF